MNLMFCRSNLGSHSAKLNDKLPSRTVFIYLFIYFFFFFFLSMPPRSTVTSTNYNPGQRTTVLLSRRTHRLILFSVPVPRITGGYFPAFDPGP